MEKSKKLQARTSLRQKRVFSESIKKKIIKDIERGKCSVLEASRELSVCQTTVYKWIYKYSVNLQKNKVLVMEEKSEMYRTKELEKKLNEALAALGRKDMELELYKKIVELVSEEYNVDIKKNFLKKCLSGLDSTKE